MTLSPKLGVVGISTRWHFRLTLPIQMFIKVASSPRLSGIGMPSPILWSHPLKMQRIVLLSSLLWWELGTNSLITGPGEWLSFQHFTSKLSWSWPGHHAFWLPRFSSDSYLVEDNIWIWYQIMWFLENFTLVFGVFNQGRSFWAMVTIVACFRATGNVISQIVFPDNLYNTSLLCFL